jgi:hypothetical protein|tara:strand:- start:463 stop:609 length:147 start_codon:yes stop_codon:yes gene_type:complete
MDDKKRLMEIEMIRKEVNEIKKLTEKTIKFLTSKKEESEILLEKLSKK